MAKRAIPFGVIGCGLMGKEFASAAARWLHLTGLEVQPEIVAACDVNEAATTWFSDNVRTLRYATTGYHDLLNDPQIEAIYCAVPHNLHAQIYADILAAGKHLFGEKPFGIDLAANEAINEAIAAHPELFVRCTSEMPYFPGAYQMVRWALDGRFGEIIEVEAGFWHSSDLNPDKVINWKRMIEVNGEYGCMGDLGMHVLHVPLRLGWQPKNVRALLSNIVRERPDKNGNMVPCETWDNAILATEVQTADQAFPMLISTKRIAPGQANTWFLKIYGTRFSAEFSSKQPKELRTLAYVPGGEQAWQVIDTPYKSAYGSVTGGIFEFGFSDAMLQMWAAFCDELAHGPEGMAQPFGCVRPEEALGSHKIFTAALESEREGTAVAIAW